MEYLYCEKYDHNTYGWQIKDYFFLMYNDGLFEIAVREILKKMIIVLTIHSVFFQKMLSMRAKIFLKA